MTEALVETLTLVVTDLHAATPLIRQVTLAHPDGAVLPGWDAGAHIDVTLPSDDRRSYSLINTSLDVDATRHPTSYRIGVRREELSAGGSAFIHGLQSGDRVTVTVPKNNFPLQTGPGEIVLLAGGIGITPIASMASELASTGRPFRLIYAGRTRADLAFVPDLEAIAGARLSLHEDDRSGVLNLGALMRALAEDALLYVCGPIGMIDAAIETARSLGWRESRLRFENFAKPKHVEGDVGFEVVLAQSGTRIRIPSDQSILDTLIESERDIPHDCKRGDCGICQVGVIEGIPDHRDYYLSEKERASNKLIQICVSRSKTPVLVLDL